MASAAAAVIPDGRRWSKGPGSSSSPVTTAIFLFFFVVVVGVLVSARWITTTTHLSTTNLDQWSSKLVGYLNRDAHHLLHPGHPRGTAAASADLLPLLPGAAASP